MSPPEETPSDVTGAHTQPLVPSTSLPLQSPIEVEHSSASVPPGSSLEGAAVLLQESSPPSFIRVNPLGGRLPTYQNPTITLLQKARGNRKATFQSSVSFLSPLILPV